MAQTNSLDLESGSSQYASATNPTALEILGDFSLETWVRFESTPSSGNSMWLIDKKSESGEDFSVYALFVNNNSGTLRLGLRTTNGTADSNIDSYANFPFEAGVWYHIAATRTSSGGGIVLYVNGRSIGTPTGYNGTLASNGGQNFYIGRYRSADGRYFDGLIKDVRIFSEVRSASDILSDAHSELVVDANLEGEWNFNNAYTDSSGNGITLTGSGSPTFPTTIPWTDPGGIDGTALETNLQGYWTFDESSGNAADSTANNNDLTNNNSATYVSGKIQNAADLENGSSQYFSITDAAQTGLDFSDALTFAGWVRFESISDTTSRYPWIVKRVGSGNQRSYLFGYFGDAGDVLFEWQTDGSSSGGSTSAAWSPSTATWYHIAITKSGTTVSIYINGAQFVAPYTGSNATIFNGTAPFQLGGWTSGDPNDYMDGNMDEWGVWSRALQYGEILDLYNGGAGISFAAGTDYDETYTETMTLVDTVPRATSRTVSETMTLVDTFEGIKVFLQELLESILLTDTIERSIGAVRTEVITLVDTVPRAVGRVFDEVVALVDTFARVLTKNVTLSETLTMVDTFLVNGSNVIWAKITKSAAAVWTKITRS